MVKRAAVVLVRRPGGDVLAVSRGVAVDQWALPGGALEGDESFASAAARELYEETGLVLTDEREVHRGPSSEETITAAFVGNAIGTVRPSTEGDVTWINPFDLVDARRTPFAGYTRELFAKLRMPTTMSAHHQLDLGVGDVSIPGGAPAAKPTRTPTVMAKINAAERKKLKPSQFGDPKNKRYPLHDKAHADDAASRLEGNKANEPSYGAIKKRIVAAQKRFGETKKSSYRPGIKGLRMTIRNADGTHVEVRHMAAYVEKTDKLYLTFPLDKVSALAGGSDDKVWIQVGRAGRWLGHPQGPFQLNAQIFDAIVRNFNSQGQGRIQYDFEHASELPPTQGSIPTEGVPAQGWIYELKHDGVALFALTEWKGKAREYIQNDQYQGVSPSIYWKCKDRVSGVDIGPMLTSVALTNKPFITNMLPLVASDAAAVMLASEDEADSVQVFSSGYCYSTGEYMPHIKAALRLGSGATPTECSEHFSRLRDKFEESDSDLGMMHDGYMMADFMTPLRDHFAQSRATTWDDLFGIVEDMIDVAIDEHNVIFHPDGPPDDAEVEASAMAGLTSLATATGVDLAGLAAVTNPTTEVQTTPSPDEQPTQGEETNMDPNNDPKSLLATAQGQVQTLTSQVQTLTAELTSKDKKVAELETDVQTLSTWKKDQETKATTARVTEAFETYGTARKLSAEDRDGWMTTLCTMNNAKFEKDFPHVAKENQHLLQTHTGSARTGAGGARVEADAPTTVVDDSKLPKMSLLTLSDKIAHERGIPLHVAQLEAERILATAAKTKTVAAK